MPYGLAFAADVLTLLRGMDEPLTALQRAIEAMKKAAAEPNNGARILLLEEALRLHRLAAAEEGAALAREPFPLSAADPPAEK